MRLTIPLLSGVLFSLTSISVNGQHGDCKLYGNYEGIKYDLCGYIIVPENYDNPAGRQIKIAYGIVKAKNSGSSQVPIVICTGGPGGRAIQGLNRWAGHPFNSNHDLILFDQRGIGFSDSLPLMGNSFFKVLAANFSLEEEVIAIEKIIKNKRAQIESSQTNLSCYNTLNSAADVGRLMKHLNYPRYILYGESYGTRLARTILDLFPNNIESIILDSPAVAEADFLLMRLKNLDDGLEKLFKYCSNDSACSSSYPNLRADFRLALAALSKEPLTCMIGNAPFTINPQDALYLVRSFMYRGDAHEVVPPFLKSLKERDVEKLSIAIQPAFGILNSLNFSMFLAVERSEEIDLTLSQDGILNAYGEYMNLPNSLALFTSLRLAAKDWHKVSLPRKTLEFVVRDTPALIVANEYDPATPPGYARVYQKQLPNSKLFILNQSGHGAAITTCVEDLLAHFADRSELQSKIGCLENIGVINKD